MFRLAVPSPIESPRCAAWVFGALFGVAAMFGYADYVTYTAQHRPDPPAYVAASQPQRVAGPASNAAAAAAPQTGFADRAAPRRSVVRRHVRHRRRSVARGGRTRHRSH